MNNFEGHYYEWRKSRMNCIDKYIDESFLNNKSLLEIGCGYADIGYDFYKKYNCVVTSIDARKEHIEVVKNRYPNLNTYVFDADNDILKEKYDIILHWGLLYHLSSIEIHLNDVCSKCNYLFLETEVCDYLDDNFRIYINENGYDQAYNNIGIKPSEKYVEKILKNNNFNFKLILDPILNCQNHKYDWINQNDMKVQKGYRRFWFCWRNDIQPTFLKN